MWSTDSAPVLGLILLSGLLGGFGHCLGMCGPVVAALSLASPGGRALAPHLLYNLGRITTYTLAGGAVGMAGALLPAVGGLARLQEAIGALTGILVFLVGLHVAGWLPLGRTGGASSPSLLQRTFGLFTGTKGTGVYFPLGMLLGLLPCGLVYGALLSAAREGMGAGSPAAGFAKGFLLMAVFGTGTAPPLLLAGAFASAASPRLRGALSRAAGVAMMAVGLLFAARILWSFHGGA